MNKWFTCFVVGAALFVTASAQALLPPLYHSLKEIQAIVNDERLTEALTSADRIETISRVPEGYVVITNKSILYVDVVYRSQDKPGPGVFDLVFHEAVSKENATTTP